MKIAVFYNLQFGGAKKSLSKIVPILGRHHRITVFEMFLSDKQFYSLPYGRNLKVQPVGSPHGLERVLFSKDLTHGIYWFLGVLPLIWQYRKIYDSIDDGEFDVFLVFPCQYFQSPLIMRYLRAPIVYLPMEPPRYVYERFSRYGRQGKQSIPKVMMKEIRKILMGAIDQKNVSFANELVAISTYAQNYLMHVYQRNVKLCHFGVDSSEFIPIPGVAKENIILSIGSLQPAKGHDFVLRSIAQMRITKYPQLVIICNSVEIKEKHYIEKLALELNIDLHIIYQITHEELVLWYNRSRVLACGQIGEPFGLVVLEALACGTPVVAVNEGGFTDFVSPKMGGILVGRDERKFAEALSFFFQNESISKEWGLRAREVVSKAWTWENTCQNLDIILHQTARK